MKKSLFSLPCLLLGLLSFTTQAQIISVAPGTDFNVVTGTIVSLENLQLTPSANFNLNGVALNKTSTATNVNTIPAISTYYKFNATTNAFNGEVLFTYLDAELNGLTKSNLKLLYHNGSAWVFDNNGTNYSGANHVTTTLTSQTLNEMSLGTAIPHTYYIDADGDGFGSNVAEQLYLQTPPAGYSVNNTDCDDTDPANHEATTTTTVVTACDSYTWDVNKQAYSVSGTYTSVTGCHTEILELTITPGSVHTTTVSACNSYTWNEVEYTVSGIYTGSTTNCVTEKLNLTITLSPVSPTLSAGGATTFCSGGSVILTSSSATGNQWYLDGSAIETGGTNQTYSANASGDYTVVVKSSGCSSNASAATSVTVLDLPTLATDATATKVCTKPQSQTTKLGYSSTTSDPTKYSITWDSTPSNNFAAITDATIPADSITITIPAATPKGIYTGTITVKNANGCVSAGTPFSLAVNSVCQPSTQVSDVVLSNITPTQFTAEWSGGDSENVIVFVQEENDPGTMPPPGTFPGSGNSDSNPADHTTYTPVSIFGQGGEIGSTGWYCVYNGPANSVTVTGLTPGKHYKIAGFGYNGTAGNEVYNTSTSTTNNRSTVDCINPTDGGAIAADQSIDIGETPASLTSTARPTGHTGGALLYQWQRATSDANNNSFSDIAAENLETYAPGSLSESTWFRRLSRIDCKADWSGAAISNIVKITASIAPHRLQVKVLLEGFYDRTNSVMTTTLNSAGLIPLTQPYNGAPWNYTGTESVASIPAGVVDWVLLELREAATPAQALPATKLTGWPKACFLKSDGTLADLNGTALPPIGNPTITGNLYLVISHRNHIAIMSATEMAGTGNNYSYDFTAALNKAYGGGAGYRQINPGVFGMVAADADCDGNISVLDFSAWATNFGKLQVYLPSDIDGDGQISVLDFSKWASNFGMENVVPLKSAIIQGPGNNLVSKFRSQVPTSTSLSKP